MSLESLPRSDEEVRREHDVELLQRADILQTIFDHIPAMIALLDDENRLLAVNREWERVFGWSSAEVLGRDDILTEIIRDPDERERGVNFIQAADGTIAEFRLTVPRGVIDTMWSNLRLSDGRIIAFGQDITERKKAEEALVEAREQLEKLAERDFGKGNQYGLTFREMTVLHLVAAGNTDAEIARLLGISLRTAQAHLAKYPVQDASVHAHGGRRPRRARRAYYVVLVRNAATLS